MIEMLRQNADKFWKRIAKRSDSECWLWMTYLSHDGYGSFQFRHNKEKKKFRAHRVSYMLTHGNCLNADQFVCHTCDNPPCVNPLHLILGDCKTNIADCIAKNRQRHLRGVQNSSAKLTDHQVINIRELIADGLSQTFIAKKFKVTKTTIAQISQGLTWKHVLSDN